MNKGYNKKVLYMPIFVLGIYIIITQLLFFIGPIDWVINENYLLLFLFCMYNISLVMGFFIGIKLKTNINTYNSDFFEIKIINFIKVALVISIFFTIINNIRTTGINPFTPWSYLEEVANGVLDPKSQYYKHMYMDNAGLFGGVYFPKLSVLLSPILWSTIPLSLFYFNKLSRFFKICSIVLILLETSRWVAIGTNKGIFDIIFIFILVFVMKSIREKKSLFKKGFNIIKYAVLLIIPLLFFTNAIKSRLGGAISLSFKRDDIYKIDFNNIFLKYTPESLDYMIIYITSYVTQGYYGLSLATKVPFTSMWGIGNSYFLIDNISDISGENIFEKSYQYKLDQFGWDPFSNWHSLYLWFANDFSLLGVSFILFIIGFLYALIWKEFLVNANPVNIVLVILFSIMLIYVPANNQILSFPSTFITFYVFLFVWIFNKLLKSKVYL